MRIVVDFPAPLGPKKPKISPRLTSKLTELTAMKLPKRRLSLSTDDDAVCRSPCSGGKRLQGMHR